LEIDEEIRPILTISEALCFKNEMEDDTINTFISDSDSVPNLTRSFLESVMNCNEQDTPESETEIETIPVTPHSSVPVEIEPGKTLNVNPDLSPTQSEQLLKILREQKEAFTWEYTDMKGIPLIYVPITYTFKRDVGPLDNHRGE
jgi:hypothetical protein